LGQAYKQDTINMYTSGCTADLGDTKCKVVLGDFTDSGSVTALSISSNVNRVFVDTSLSESDRHYDEGIITWKTGNNAGIQMEVRGYLLSDPAETNDASVTLLEPMLLDIQVGDTYDISAGCDKSIGTCFTKFDNVINFRGFPHIPGVAEMNNYGNRVSEVT